MIESKAYGIYIFIKRDAEPAEIAGLDLPDLAKKKPNTGTILSVGHLVGRGDAKPGRKAIFAKAIGEAYNIDGEETTVIREDQLLGTSMPVYDPSK